MEEAVFYLKEVRNLLREVLRELQLQRQLAQSMYHKAEQLLPAPDGTAKEKEC